MPYYLHLLDRAQGGLHFEVSREKTCKIIDNMQLAATWRPGWWREKGKSSKTAISWIWARLIQNRN